MVSETLFQQPKYQAIKVQLIAREKSLSLTTFGRNTDSYISESRLKHGQSELIRLSFRFLHQESRIPDSFLDYAAIHEFRALRDPSCDGSLQSLLHRSSSWKYAENAPQIDATAETILPCYVVTPEDYKGSKHLKLRPR